MSQKQDTTRRAMGAVAVATVIGAGLALGTAIPAQATDTTEVFWLLPETVTELPTGNTAAIWPQQYLPDGVVPCGRFGQADVYSTADVPALVADGVLAEGEDYSVVLSWRFVYGGDCAPEEPPVDVCLNVDGIQEVIPEGLEAGPATGDGPTCVPADVATPGVPEKPEEDLPVALPLMEEPPTLAYTGPSDLMPLGVVAALLLTVGGALIRKRVAL